MPTETITWRLSQDETPLSFLVVLAKNAHGVFPAYWTGDAWNLARTHAELDGVTLWAPMPSGPK